jgi:predicted RNA binding protein YcfA (HicA-like mRNA interferase family)
MAMNPSKPATYRDLVQLLARLGFQDESVEGSHRAFRHGASETLILLAEFEPEDPLRAEDLISARRHLVAKGLISAHAFERQSPQSAATGSPP